MEKHVVVAKEEAEKPRAGKTVEVAAYSVGEEAAARTGGGVAFTFTHRRVHTAAASAHPTR